MNLDCIIQEIRLKDHTLELYTSPNKLFTPNKVTQLFSEVITINPDDIVFDIGSGVGPLAIWAALKPSKFVYAVETVEDQYKLALKNVKKYNLEHKVKVYHGNLFEPIPQGLKANVIIADVSGIAEGPARIMSTNDISWYPPCIPTGGKDGTKVIIPVLEQAADYLRGRIYFPVAGLSDHEKIMRVAESKFECLIMKVNPHFPIEQEQLQKLINDQSSGKYTIRKNISRWVWDGWIYEASNSKL